MVVSALSVALSVALVLCRRSLCTIPENPAQPPLKPQDCPQLPGVVGRFPRCLWAPVRDGLPEVLQEFAIFPGRTTKSGELVVVAP